MDKGVVGQWRSFFKRLWYGLPLLFVACTLPTPPSSSTTTASFYIEANAAEANAAEANVAEANVAEANVAEANAAEANAAPTIMPLPTEMGVATVPPVATPTQLVASAVLGGMPTPVYTTAVIGYSTENRPIEEVQFNDGPISIVVVGGLHGGYEWNTILLAYELIDYFAMHGSQIPDFITLTIIPSANPDGQVAVVGQSGRFEPPLMPLEATFQGRFNANQVDLNRNWDCDWTPTAFWQDQPVAAGEAPFSEQETRLLRNWFLQRGPTLVIFLHSAGSGIFPGWCGELFLPSVTFGRIYATASGYPLYEAGFTSYPVTGDASDWLASQNIASFTVELVNHRDTDFRQNVSGLLAIMVHYERQNQRYPVE